MEKHLNNRLSAEFGYYPKALEISNERFTIQTLSNLKETVSIIEKDPNIHKDWIYSEEQRSIDFRTREVRTLPYKARIFSLPKTHEIILHNSSRPQDLDFVIWCLSFFTGMRLTATEAGFLDVTPIKPTKLVDFVLVSCTLTEVVELALNYLDLEGDNFHAAKRVMAVIQALFLAQYPHGLPFEQFQYLYMGLDSCFKLISDKQEKKTNISHTARLKWMCEKFGIPVPDWAITNNKNQSEISVVRNEAFHEALFFNEPLGFSVYSGNQHSGSKGNVILEMRNLVCRLLVAILGKSEAEYIKTPVNTRQRHSLTL